MIHEDSDAGYTSSREEMLALLSEYTEELKAPLEKAIRREAFKITIFYGIIIATLFAVVFLIFSGIAGGEAKWEAYSRIELGNPLFTVFAGLLYLWLGGFVIGLQARRFSNQMEVSSKILGRILSRAVQLTDHNKSKLDFTFEIKIAEAEAVLENYMHFRKKPHTLKMRI